MSFSRGQADSFVDPIRGKTTTFLFAGREDNLAFAKAAVALVTAAGRSCAVLDLDALYGSNADVILGALPPDALRLVTVSVPDAESKVEQELLRVVSSSAEVLIIDSFNTFFHLLSYDDAASRGRKLSFAVASMSYLARTSGRAVFFTMYRRSGIWRQGPRPISGLSDATASVRVQGTELLISCERGTAWPGGSCSIRIP